MTSEICASMLRERTRRQTSCTRGGRQRRARLRPDDADRRGRQACPRVRGTRRRTPSARSPPRRLRTTAKRSSRQRVLAALSAASVTSAAAKRDANSSGYAGTRFFVARKTLLARPRRGLYRMPANDGGERADTCGAAAVGIVRRERANSAAGQPYSNAQEARKFFGGGAPGATPGAFGSLASLSPFLSYARQVTGA